MTPIANLFTLRGRSALVTGGSTGIGAAMARALGAAGARLLLVARRSAELIIAVDNLRAQGVDAQWLASDLTQLDSLPELALHGERLLGGIDILVNAAGVNLRQPIAEVTPQTWHQQLSVHEGAPFFLSQALAPSMAERGRGRILNVATLQSTPAFDNSAPYGTAKGGIVQLTRAMAQAWSRYGITCNAISPAFSRAALTTSVFGDESLAKKQTQTCVGRSGALEDLFGSTVFLASDASAYITGQILMVDGGYTAK